MAKNLKIVFHSRLTRDYHGGKQVLMLLHTWITWEQWGGQRPAPAQKNPLVFAK